MIRPSHILVPALSAVMLIGLSSAAQAGTAPSAATVTSAQTAAAATPISFVGSASSSANVAAPAVTVPATTQVGDTMILTASLGNATAATATTGWTLKGDQNATSALRSLVWSRTATAADAGKPVAVTMETIHKSALSVSVYRGVDAAKALTATANTDANVTSHTTPAVTVAADSRVVSYWSERGAATTQWTTSPSVMRASGYSAGGGRVSTAVGDADAASSGAVSGSTATTDALSTVGINWSIVLPAPTPPPPASTTVFGMNVSPGTSFTNGASETAAQQVSRITSTYGSLGVAKIFYQGMLPATFNKSYEGLVPGKTVAVCFKPSQTSLASGALDAQIKGYIDSIPAGWKVMLVNWQEPDDEMWKDNVFTMEQHRAATERLIDVARANAAYAADKVEVWDVYMGYSLDVGRWKDAAASPRLDGIGWDYYWNKPTTDWSIDPTVALTKMADTNKRIGIKDYGLFETGDNPHTNDTTGSGRAAFWTKVFNSSQTLGYDYVIYFNAIGTTGDHRILPGTAFSDPTRAELSRRMMGQ